MIPDSLDFILRATNEEQAEYAAAAHKNSPAADVEGASAAGAQTPAAGLVAGPPTTAPRPQENPTWSPVDDSTGDLLDLLANEHPAIPSEADEWEHFKKVLAEAAKATGYIDQNAVRPLLRGEIKPQRIGAFYHRATKGGLISWDGTWRESDDLAGKNSGKPTRVYRWLGT